MGTYVMTGGATGIGAATKVQLEADRHTVFVIDIQGGDFQADLSDPDQRNAAVKAVESRFPDGIDGFIPCAGLGPNAKPLSLITKVNFFASVAMTEALMPLVKMRRGCVVMVSSNSASMPGLNQQYIDLCLERDEQSACELIETLDGHNAYAGSKLAMTQWMRRNNAAYAAEGVRVNAVAPGITRTPLTDKVLADKALGQVMKDFGDSVPIGRLGEPEEVARSIVFLLSEQASFISGSVLFIDGGHDALLRPDQF